MVRRLVLWDIDRTLLYVGQVDRQVYRDVFAELVGYQPERLPAKGTGRTVPLAVAEMFATNGIDDSQAKALTARALELIPHRFASYRRRLAQEGVLRPGATAALQAVRALPDTVASVVTGNLRANALVKLETFGLAGYLEAEVGGFVSDDPHRPALVGIAQQRAGERYRARFTRANTVIVGDSAEDVVAGRDGGARVIAVASGTTSPAELRERGADVVQRPA